MRPCDGCAATTKAHSDISLALSQIHIFPYARYFEEVASSDKPGDDPEVPTHAITQSFKRSISNRGVVRTKAVRA